ncbi:ABC transporter permease [Fuscibacter oryzae]|uniref:ABC transporter permease n=1 Tax=Fuscibacter oryzae TaxID=2803939 RepID=A0A8J7MY37_9RHOB|nr:ABC transporter permease [Fuscibacter oryzae]MBL4929414.1 ABC transporter permease [Fuscibacter oryzae]
MLRAYAVLYIAVLYVPILFIVLFSFHSSAALTFPFEGLSLRWYREALADPALLDAFLNSVKVGLLTTLITTVIGSMAALAFARIGGRLKKIFGFLSFAPIALPGLFIGISLLTLFSQLGMQRSLWTVTLSHVVITLPFFIESCRSRLEFFDLSIEEAARDLGARPFTVFRLVTLPILAPTLIGAAILSFAISFDEVIITVFVSGNQSTLPLYIWSMMRLSVTPLINATSVIAIASVILLVLAMSMILGLRRARARQQRHSRNTAHV